MRLRLQLIPQFINSFNRELFMHCLTIFAVIMIITTCIIIIITMPRNHSRPNDCNIIRDSTTLQAIHITVIACHHHFIGHSLSSPRSHNPQSTPFGLFNLILAAHVSETHHDFFALISHAAHTTWSSTSSWRRTTLNRVYTGQSHSSQQRLFNLIMVWDNLATAALVAYTIHSDRFMCSQWASGLGVHDPAGGCPYPVGLYEIIDRNATNNSTIYNATTTATNTTQPRLLQAHIDAEGKATMLRSSQYTWRFKYPMQSLYNPQH